MACPPGRGDDDKIGVRVLGNVCLRYSTTDRRLRQVQIAPDFADGLAAGTDQFNRGSLNSGVKKRL